MTANGNQIIPTFSFRSVSRNFVIGKAVQSQVKIASECYESQVPHSIVPAVDATRYQNSD